MGWCLTDDRFQITTDGYPFYCSIQSVFAGRADVERQNLTMRMAMRRLTRLTNAFSKKPSHLKAACALHFAHYNFCRVPFESARDSGNGSGNRE